MIITEERHVLKCSMFCFSALSACLFHLLLFLFSDCRSYAISFYCYLSLVWLVSVRGPVTV